ncbi:MAG: hypothetical protein GXY44_01830 [Phycisphaerales bacterium]|nr:hypothetical protein [Phycisphaerales bacterium]
MAKNRTRWKVAGYTGLFLVLGIGLLVLSQVIRPSTPTEQVPQTSTAPVDQDRPAPGKDASAENLSNMMVLFGTAALIGSVVGIGWIVIDIRNSRPVWKTQTKFPKKR